MTSQSVEEYLASYINQSAAYELDSGEEGWTPALVTAGVPVHAYVEPAGDGILKLVVSVHCDAGPHPLLLDEKEAVRLEIEVNGDPVYPAPDVTDQLRGLFERRWRCDVVASGYHNGAKCDPDEPHDDVWCGYRWMAPALKAAEAHALGLVDTEGTTQA